MCCRIIFKVLCLVFRVCANYFTFQTCKALVRSSDHTCKAVVRAIDYMCFSLLLLFFFNLLSFFIIYFGEGK